MKKYDEVKFVRFGDELLFKIFDKSSVVSVLGYYEYDDATTQYNLDLDDIRNLRDWFNTFLGEEEDRNNKWFKLME